MGIITLDRIVRAGDLFNSLEREEEREPERRFEVKTNPRLEELIEIFGKVNKPDSEYNIYNEYVELTKGIYSSSEIEQLSLMLTEKNINYFSSKYGLFLSSLINRSTESVMTIHTNHIETPAGFIGYKNDGRIINVHGNVGEFLGNQMKSGKIIVNGNARFDIGYNMSGGKIVLNGNAGNDVGSNMKSGEIHLNGDYESLFHSIFGGNIYHKGVQIIKEGKIVPGAKIKWP